MLTKFSEAKNKLSGQYSSALVRRFFYRRRIIRSLTEISFMVLRILIITLSTELRFQWSSTLWKAYEIIYKNIQESISLDQVLSIEISGDRRIIRSPTEISFMVLRILIITLRSELRFRWSCTLWKAYEIIYKNIQEFISLDQASEYPVTVGSSGHFT